MSEVLLRFGKLKFFVPRDSGFLPYYLIFFAGEYEQLLNDIESTDVVLDAGAHIGFFTLAASLKAKKVIAVEPWPENFELLCKNVQANEIQNVILANKALSNYNGKGFILGKGLGPPFLIRGSKLR